MDKQKAIVFLKIGIKEHMEDFLNGYLYFNTVQYFAELEDNVNRGDPYESAVEIHNQEVNGGHLQVIKQYNKDYACGNILCLYRHEVTVTESNKKFQSNIDAKNLGDYCVVILNHKEFTNRVIKQLKKEKHTPVYGPVKYYDFNKGYIKRTAHKKDLKFEYQNEYRFYFNRNKNKFKGFNIGSIADIAYMDTIESFLSSSFMYIDIEKLLTEKVIKERD